MSLFISLKAGGCLITLLYEQCHHLKLHSLEVLICGQAHQSWQEPSTLLPQMRKEEFFTKLLLMTSDAEPFFVTLVAFD